MTNFEKWFNENLRESASDIASYGADQGYPHITYYSDTTELYDKYESDIQDMLQELAEGLGESKLSLIQGFNRQDMLQGFYNTLELDDQAKCLLVWFACEELSHKVVDEVA